MPRVTFKIDGLRELEKTMMEFPAASAKSVARKALLEAAQPFVDEIQEKAPRLSGTLSASASSGTKLSRRQRSLHKKESDYEVFAGFGALPQAITEEFGTVHIQARPTVTPAWEANKRGMLDSIKEALATQIEKTAKRLARRSEKYKR